MNAAVREAKIANLNISRYIVGTKNRNRMQFGCINISLFSEMQEYERRDRKYLCKMENKLL